MSCRCVRGRLLSADIGARMTAESEVGAVMRSASSITARMIHACEVGRGDFLQISPEVMWLTEANDFTGIFEVMANVKWNVE